MRPTEKMLTATLSTTGASRRHLLKTIAGIAAAVALAATAVAA